MPEILLLKGVLVDGTPIKHEVGHRFIIDIFVTAI